MKLKLSVAIAMAIALFLMTLILIVGLLPSSVLEKFSHDKTASGVGNQTKIDSESHESEKSSEDEKSDDGHSENQNSTNNSQTSTSASPSTPTSTNTTKTTTNTSTTAQQPTTSGGTTSGGSTAQVAPTLTFSGSPTIITSGSSSVLSWSINSNATATVTCTASGAWSGAKATSGSQSVSPTSTSSYSLICSNAAGNSGTKTVSITVNAPVASCGSAGGSCTAAQVAAHNTQSNCWAIYSGSYYVLSGANLPSGKSSYPSQHPGGAIVFDSVTCGQDITTYMNGSSGHNGKHSHSGGAYSVLNSYKVGPVN